MKNVVKFSLFLFFLPIFAHAFKADALVGTYKVLSQTIPGPPGDFIVDTNTLQWIWKKYVDTALPPDLLPYKDRGAIIAGFTTHRPSILTLEEGAVIGAGYMRIDDTDAVMEMGRRPNGQSDLIVTHNGRVSKYLLDVPGPARQ